VSASLGEALERAQTRARSEPSQSRIPSGVEAQFLTAKPSSVRLRSRQASEAEPFQDVALAVPFQNTVGQTSTQNHRSHATNSVQTSASGSNPAFGGTYEALNPQQKKLLDAAHQRQGIELFVASFSAVQRKDGDVVSYCVWGEGNGTPSMFGLGLFKDEPFSDVIA